jgi:hypothetical protein
MNYVPYAPRQACRSPTTPGNTFSNPDLDYLDSNDTFCFDDNPYFDFSSFSLNSSFSETFIPNFGNYNTDPLASREPISKTNPNQGGYNFHQYQPRSTLLENLSDIDTFHGTSLLEPQKSQQVHALKSTTEAKRKETIAKKQSNSPESADSPSSNSSRNLQKRKLEDMMQTFSAVPDNSDNQASEKRRKNYDPKTRKKVALIRKIGPCKRCGVHRIAVSEVINSSLATFLMVLV